jgi:hypothetical protein
LLPVVRVSLPRVTVIVPTIDGRQDHMARCTAAYFNCAHGSYELDFIVMHNFPTCGHGWQAGLSSVQGQYVHFTCDDIEPRPGWAQPAIEAVERGFLPAPQVYDPQGTPQSYPLWGHVGQDWAEVNMTTLPFVSRAQLEKIVPLFTSHYFSDDWFSYRGRKAGWPSRLRTGYSFTHHWAQHQRGAGMTEGQRLNYDRVLFDQAVRMSEMDRWDMPWPTPEIARPPK